MCVNVSVCACTCMHYGGEGGGVRAFSREENKNWFKLWGVLCKPVSWVKAGGPGTLPVIRSLRKRGYFQDSLCTKGCVLPSNWCSLGMKDAKAVYIHPTPCPGWYWLLCPRKGILNSVRIPNSTDLHVLLIRWKAQVGVLGIHAGSLQNCPASWRWTPFSKWEISLISVTWRKGAWQQQDNWAQLPRFCGWQEYNSNPKNSNDYSYF